MEQTAPRFTICTATLYRQNELFPLWTRYGLLRHDPRPTPPSADAIPDADVLIAKSVKISGNRPQFDAMPRVSIN